MEEDGGVKAAPVTRLRRRISVEQSEDGNSSPAPSTPTKKRGGRLAAKSQLELINKNTPVSSPRITRRKSLATEAEEKPITPSRRSARIKSNISIVSETQLLPATDSPRAKRAARRTSQAGSDNEGPTTPARQTRRTRKDSASSVENQESGTLSKPLPVTEMVIEEEPENEVQKTVDKSMSSPAPASEELSPNSAKKSKLLLAKTNRRSGSNKSDHDTSINKSLNISTTDEKASSEAESISRSPVNKSFKSKERKDDLSESNMSLLTKIDTETKLNKSNHNNSTSALNTEQNYKSKRNRTESWPTITTSGGNESINLSDNELSRKEKNKSHRLSVNNDSPKINKNDTSLDDKNTSRSFLDTSSKRKKRQSDTPFTKETEQSKDDNLQATEARAPNEGGVNSKEISNVQSDNTNITSDVAILFETAPDNVQVTVYLEDSDSNGVSIITADKHGHLDSDDQCVPVVKRDFKESLSPENPSIVSNAELVFSKEISKNNTSYSIPKEVNDDVDNSCEPMDIDETIHEEIVQTSETTEQSKSQLQSLSMTEETNKSKRFFSISNAAADTSDLSKTIQEKTDKSKRKSSISHAAADTLGLSETSVGETNKSKRKSTISNSAEDAADLSKIAVEDTNKSKRKSLISSSDADALDRSETTEEETKKSKTKISKISNVAADTSGLSKTTEAETNKSKRTSSISNDVQGTTDLSKTTVKETTKSMRKSSISNLAEDASDLPKTAVEETNKSNRKSTISKSAEDSADLSKTAVEEINKSKRKSSISSSDADALERSKTTEEETKKSKRKVSSISNAGADTSGLSKTTEAESNKSKRKSSISNAAQGTKDLSKSTVKETTKSMRKSSISNLADDASDLPKTAVDETNKSNRKSSISNSAEDSADLSKTAVQEINKSKRKSTISSSDADALERSKTTEEETKKSKRKVSSISNAGADTSGLSKTTEAESNKSKRKSSISNAAQDTSERSKDDNKSTLILSQIKDVSNTSENPNSPKPLLNEVLSKSEVNLNSIVNKEVTKGNLSLNDVKGTPKQKHIQKLTMQTSTPIITQQTDIETKGNKKNDGTEKNKTNFSKSVNYYSDSSEEGSDYGESSLEKSKLLNDEAEEASDDYESGDSQDEEEKIYEAENEIVERGETLTSDDDASNDTDYEKDSFTVSSDPEDNELLSGSGDDLDMSDNELTMSKKSKKKFNERKLKEQKNASREMFASRHKLNTSDQNSPAHKIKKNRMRLDSSLLESDEEEIVKPKKNNRMRLNSTLDTNVKQEDTNANKSKKKDKSLQEALDTTDKHEVANVSLKKGNKNKSMQESICYKSALDDIEITIFNESTTDNADPLKVHLKQEPKTPQKDLNISVVQFTHRQEIENVQITESNSVLNQTGTDPLQATMTFEEPDSSESEQIMQSYDSVLNDLNKDKKAKLNNNNVSLNMDHKSKKNRVEPIIDQLNLTQSKKSKNNKNTSKDVVDSKSVESSAKTPESDNESSTSIDLQLLFSEDNASEDESQKNKAKDSTIIPLKKTPGKTNIRESIDPSDETSLNKSTSTKNKGRSSLSLESPEEPEEPHGNESTLNKSSSKKKKQRTSLTAVESQELPESMYADDTNELNKSKSKKKKQKASSADEAAAETPDVRRGSLNESGIKKKKRHSVSEPQVEESQDIRSGSLNESGTKKKKKHSVSEPAVEESQDVRSGSLNDSGIKKKKKHLSVSEPAVQESQDMLNKSKNIDVSLNESGLKKKKKLFISEPTVDESQDMRNISKDMNVSLNQSGLKKKKKLSISQPAVEESLEINNAEPLLNESIKKKKKRKSSLNAQDTEPPADNLFFMDTKGTLGDNKVDDDSDGAPDEAPYLSEKPTEVHLQNTEFEVVTESVEAGSGKKKKKKKKSVAAANQEGQSIDTGVDIASNSKKRKRKSSNAESSQGDAQESVEIVTVNEAAGSQTKKRKISHNDDKKSSGTTESMQAKKKNKKNLIFQESAVELESVETHVKKNKKRKNRDEDGDNKQAKVSKDSSFQEVHVPRLPDNILSQLDDKPRKRDTATVISTSNFIVETARQKRAKPSNYLEESIYLDANSPIAKKEKPRIKKPKVLPFIPTASISDSGFTTNFKINKLSQTTKFEAEPFSFSKESYLQKKNIKRLGTYDRYKKQIHHKLSKF